MNGSFRVANLRRQEPHEDGQTYVTIGDRAPLIESKRVDSEPSVGTPIGSMRTLLRLAAELRQQRDALLAEAQRERASG